MTLRGLDMIFSTFDRASEGTATHCISAEC